jgi:hypothetical protein
MYGPTGSFYRTANFSQTSLENNLNITEINSLEDILEYEKESDLRLDLQRLVAPLKIDTDNTEDLLKVINILKNKWVDLMCGPFVSEQKEYIYYLTKLEGKQRNKALGLTDDHYSDKRLATKWKRSLAMKVAGDRGGCDEAMKVLLSIYDVLVDDSREEDE